MPPLTKAAPVPALLALLGALAATGCSSIRPIQAVDDGLAPGGLVLTQYDIQRLGAIDAMDVVNRSQSHLKIQRVRNGDPVKITQRGVGTFYLSPEILVIVDGARVNSPIRYLEAIPASSIRFVQILSAREAAMTWGSEAGNGVILVLTSAQP